MTATRQLADQGDRERARDALDSTVFVTAGAGAGKTRLLVDRICGLVTRGPSPVPMRNVAAVTFTEKAAAEMRDRVRAELTRLVAERDGEVADRARDALTDLDLAAIGTLHSFARRLLSENPVEAGLPPVIRPLDEVASTVRAEHWWTDVRARLLTDEHTAPAMQVLLAADVRLESVRDLTRRMQADWDLVRDRCARTPARTTLRLDTGPLHDAVTGLERRAATDCHDPADKLFAAIPRLRTWLGTVSDAADDLERLRLIEDVPKFGNVGSAKNWDDVASVKADVKALRELAVAVCDEFVRVAVDVVVAALSAAVLDEADQRRRDGELQFQDLLVQASSMLAHSSAARAAASGRYRRLLLDEFQDTDPLQIEIAVRILAGDAGGAEAWQHCPVPDGGLFVVGDPKQSIYRFRRASIATFLGAQRTLAPTDPAVLSVNFRSHPRLLDWVNHTFGRLITAVPGGQPAYQPLDPDSDRVRFQLGETDPRVTVLGDQPVDAEMKADELHAYEARLVAAELARMLHHPPPVEQRRDGGWTSRPVQAADVAILVPARTTLGPLEQALDDLGIPYRTEASSLVYRSDEVRDLLLTARAVDDPSDALALVSALRTPLFGCGDDDLVDWRAAGGRFSIHADRPDSLTDGHPVAEAVGYLRWLSNRRSAMSPSELLAHIVERRRALEVAADDRPRYRETWRRLRYVVDQARAWSEAEHGSLRDFLDWAALQAEQEERANEIVLPERDVAAVRILTMHAAKGLEFPVVVLSGMTSSPRTDPGSLVWPESGPPQVRLSPRARTAGWEDAREAEATLLHLESLRLLYVAATRAESRLVVSLVRTGRRKGLPDDRRRWTRAELVAHACQGGDHAVSTADAAGVSALPPLESEVTAPMPWEVWARLRDTARARAAEREADSATDIAKGRVPVPEGLAVPDGLAKEPRDLELPAWLKGRYGAAVGRAVHATLQTVDLTTGDGLDGVADAQALAEGVVDRAASVRALARAGWGAPVVRRAARREHHKETYVGTVLGGQLVEGYIDLLYREDDGALVVVDYKTDADPSPDTLAAYRTQLAVYARAVADATGERVSHGVLVFCREHGAAEATVTLGGPEGEPPAAVDAGSDAGPDAGTGRG